MQRIILLSLVCIVCAQWAIPNMESENCHTSNFGWFCDPDNLVENERELIEDMQRSIHDRDPSIKVGVLVVKQYNLGQSLQQFSRLVFNFWGIEKGILFCVSVNDRQFYISTSSDLDFMLGPSVQGRVKGKIVPSFRLGQYGHGIVDGLNEIGASIFDPYQLLLPFFFFLFILICVVILIIISSNGNSGGGGGNCIICISPDCCSSSGGFGGGGGFGGSW